MFLKDDGFSPEIDRYFGKYMITYKSENNQVRADLFDRGGLVAAHVSFPTGLEPGSVTDPYFVALWSYAREHDLADRFKLIYS